jgi:exonuclease III
VPVLKGWHANYIKVPTANLIKPQKIGEKTKLFASVFLERYNGEKIRSMEISLGEIIRVVSGILNLEFKDAFSYLYVLAAVGYFDMADFQTQQKEILQKTFSNIKLYRIYIPQNIKIEEYLNYMDKFVNNLTQ